MTIQYTAETTSCICSLEYLRPPLLTGGTQYLDPETLAELPFLPLSGW